MITKQCYVMSKTRPTSFETEWNIGLYLDRKLVCLQELEV